MKSSPFDEPQYPSTTKFATIWSWVSLISNAHIHFPAHFSCLIFHSPKPSSSYLHQQRSRWKLIRTVDEDMKISWYRRVWKQLWNKLKIGWKRTKLLLRPRKGKPKYASLIHSEIDLENPLLEVEIFDLSFQVKKEVEVDNAVRRKAARKVCNTIHRWENLLFISI